MNKIDYPSKSFHQFASQMLFGYRELKDNDLLLELKINESILRNKDSIHPK